MEYRLSRHGRFMSCKKFPECKGARKEDGSVLEEPKELDEKCPECGAPLIEREGRFGKFIACSNYPKCKFVRQSESEKKGTGIACPKCGKGEIVEKRGRFGVFYACSEYPKCNFTMRAKPTGDKCPICGALMMEGTKTIPERCSDKNCPMHNPHRLNKK